MENLKNIAWIVADGLMQRQFLSKFINERGYVAKTFSSFEDLKWHFHSMDAPDLLVVYEDKDGDYLSEQLKAFSPDQSIMVLSTVQLMAMRQFELSHDANAICLDPKKQSQDSLERALKWMQTLNL